MTIHSLLQAVAHQGAQIWSVAAESRTWLEAAGGLILAHLNPPPTRWNVPRLAWLWLQSLKLRRPAGPLLKGNSPMDMKKALQYVNGLVALGELAFEIAQDQTDAGLSADAKLQKEAAAVEAKAAPVLEAFGMPATIATELTAPSVVEAAASVVALAEKIAAAIEHKAPAVASANP